MEKKSIKVFIVDDDKFLLGMYALKFANSGYDVDTAVGSAPALEKLRAGAKPDVLLLDVVMRNMSGLELLKTIKAENLAQGSLVIMLTNQSDAADVSAAKSLGVDGYIIKAATVPSEVLQEVERVWAAKRGAKR